MGLFLISRLTVMVSDRILIFFMAVTLFVTIKIYTKYQFHATRVHYQIMKTYFMPGGPVATIGRKLITIFSVLCGIVK